MAKLHTIVDNFNDNNLDTGVWETTGTHAESNGRTILTPVTSGVASRLRTVATNYDATESYIAAHIPVITATGTSGTLQSGLAITDTATGNLAGIRKVGTDILCEKVLSGGTVTTIVYQTLYSSTNHLYWRLRESGGLFYWETSANGSGWTQLFSTTVSTNLFPLTSVRPYFITAFTGVEASPGTFQIESVNAIYLRNLAGLHALSYTSQSVTNNTTTTHAITASGTTVSTGSAALTILAVGTGGPVRDIAGNIALGYTNQLVTNNTTSSALPISASGSTTTTGTARVNKILAISGTGTSGGGVSLDEDVQLDSPLNLDANFTAGSAALTVLPAGATAFITGSGITITSGSAAIQVVPVGGITGTGSTLFSGDGTLTVPVVGISASGITTLSGSGRLTPNHAIYGTGTTFFTGNGGLTVLTRSFQFEPPVVYDLPPTLPNPRPRYINAHARWKGGQRRGRTVLKNAGVYTLHDTPTVDQVNSADIAYQGGHIYTIDQDEAAALRNAGFTVIGTEPFPTPSPTSAFPDLTTFPAESLFPAT